MKQNTALLRFYEELNNFLPQKKRKLRFEYHFHGNLTIKDIIASIGVPPAEVDLILVNEKSVDFFYQVKNNDMVSVYPIFESFDISTVSRLRTKALREPKFILDANLGKLAKYLRLFGFDALYQNNNSLPDIIELAKKDKSIILTKKKNVLKKKIITHGYRIKALDPEKQIEEVVNRFDLFSKMKPFTLCLKCNVKIAAIEKNKTIERVPFIVRKRCNEFYICPKCKRIYWQGSHYKTMSDLVRKINN